MTFLTDSDRVRLPKSTVDAEHARQNRYTFGSHGGDEIEKCIGHYGYFNPVAYSIVRFHPINVNLPWIIFYLGSVVNLD